MKLWQLQQILCRYHPDATVYVKMWDDGPRILDGLEDKIVRSDGECSCASVGGHITVKGDCPKHGLRAAMRCPMLVVGPDKAEATE